MRYGGGENVLGETAALPASQVEMGEIGYVQRREGRTCGAHDGCVSAHLLGAFRRQLNRDPHSALMSGEMAEGQLYPTNLRNGVANSRPRDWRGLFRPTFGRPVPGCMDHPQDHDRFLAGALRKRVGDDVWEPGDRLFVGPGDAATSACRVLPQRLDCIPNPIRDPQRGRSVIAGDVGDLRRDVVQGLARPVDCSRHAVVDGPAASIAAWISAMASSWGTSRPTSMSAKPVFIPWMISSSRST